MSTTSLQAAIGYLSDAALTSLASAGADHGVRSMATLFDRRRAEHGALYDEFLRLGLRVQYRLRVLLTLQSSHSELTSVPERYIGYPMLMQMLERLVDDLAALTHTYRRLALQCPRGEYDAAELVLALTARMEVVDPGWVVRMRPSRRRAFAADTVNADDRLASCLRRMDLRVAMDTGPGLLVRRRARKQYKLHVIGGNQRG